MWALLLTLIVGVALKNNAEAAVSSNDAFNQYDEYYRNFGKQFKVPWRWIKAIAIVESNQGAARTVAYGLANPTDVDGSRSFDGLSWGVMQVTLSTARWLEGQQLQVPYMNVAENSIRIGAKYLAYLVSQFGYDSEKVSRGYNGGPTYFKRVTANANTLIYWGKFKTALETVMIRQPGNELEY